MVVSQANFYQDVTITWGDERGKILNGGNLLTLSLDKASGSGFQSNNQFLFGRFDMQIKLVPGNSAGTVTTYYLSSQGSAHDEVDFEFLGNLSGSPYTLQTNVYSQGKGNREQQFHLWFDPTQNFHTYSAVWTRQRILFLVDNIPIRVFNNLERMGVPYPNRQPMRVYSTIWDGDSWATRGGSVKVDWTQAPFTASYQNFAFSSRGGGRGPPRTRRPIGQRGRTADAISQRQLRWVQQNFMIYNYCTDKKRFPGGFAPECRFPGFL
ncbi:hypothetical protein ACFE04_002985 [Oxalis oulophora]